MTTLGQLGERALIERLRRRLKDGTHVACGIGDDAAVVQIPGAADDLVLTSDAVLERRHFQAGDAPESIGHKAIGRALSDLAAMGASPRWALLDLVAHPDMDVVQLERLYDGLARLADRHGLAIIGGDTTSGERLDLHVFAIGAVPSGKALLRSGARPGDVLCVTGALGGSILGHHLAFEPRVREGQWLRDWATAMIDLSDGLATDAHHLALASNVEVELDAARIPLSPDATRMPSPLSALEHALTDGEDFELLFSVPAARVDACMAAWHAIWQTPCRPIGRIAANAPRLTLIAPDGGRTALHSTGFEHFRERPSPHS